MENKTKIAIGILVAAGISAGAISYLSNGGLSLGESTVKLEMLGEGFTLLAEHYEIVKGDMLEKLESGGEFSPEEWEMLATILDREAQGIYEIDGALFPKVIDKIIE